MEQGGGRGATEDNDVDDAGKAMRGAILKSSSLLSSLLLLLLLFLLLLSSSSSSSLLFFKICFEFYWLKFEVNFFLFVCLIN